jgi:cellulose synthase/poly-beta-1,6-N-acetylglucosamine synthase-like glycosyltransferase
MAEIYIPLLISGLLHIGYVLLSVVFPKRQRKIRNGSKRKYSVEHIVCFKNESKFIKKKLDNCYRINYDNLCHTFINDNSQDDTLSLLKQYRRPGTTLINNETDMGKNQSQIKAAENSDRELLLFTDANVFLKKDALNHLVRYFDENTSGISGNVTITTDMAHKELPGKYWEIEKSVKNFQSLSGSMIGFDGGFYCVRRKHYKLKKENELSDFETAFLLFKQKKQTKYAEDAVAVELEKRKIKDSFKARIRASNRVFWSYKRILRYAYNLKPAVLIHFLLHKLCRYLFVVTFILSLPFILVDLFQVSPFLLLVFFIPHVYRFVIESAALCIGGIIALAGKQYTTWSNKKA